MIKIIAHETTMDIPIFNSLYICKQKKIQTKKINFNNLNSASFHKVYTNKYPSVNIIKKLPNESSLYETALVTANDEFVKLFLNKRIKYNDIYDHIIKIINQKEFKNLKKFLPTKISDVINVSKSVKSKIQLMYQ